MLSTNPKLLRQMDANPEPCSVSSLKGRLCKGDLLGFLWFSNVLQRLFSTSSHRTRRGYLMKKFQYWSSTSVLLPQRGRPSTDFRPITLTCHSDRVREWSCSTLGRRCQTSWTPFSLHIRRTPWRILWLSSLREHQCCTPEKAGQHCESHDSCFVIQSYLLFSLNLV